jgi:hypothetical protein
VQRSCRRDFPRGMGWDIFLGRDGYGMLYVVLRCGFDQIANVKLGR